MKKKILVLGGHGFMGKNISEAFKGPDYEMFYLSREDDVNVAQKESLMNALEIVNPDIIINAAAHVGSISYVSKYAADVIHDNSAMYLTLYSCVAAFNKDIVIINPISNCSYPGIIDVQDEDKWWDGPIHPSVESYGTPKKLGFILSECYKRQYGVKTVNLIIPNAYGPNDYLDEERTHAMNGIIMRMIKAQNNVDSKFVIWGTGTPIREWIYMPDMGRIYKEIIDKEMFDLPNPINIGQEFGISINELVQKVKVALDYDVEIETDLTKQDGAPIKVLGNKLFKEHFPDFEFTTYNKGIKEAIDYYKKNMYADDYKQFKFNPL